MSECLIQKEASSPDPQVGSEIVDHDNALHAEIARLRAALQRIYDGDFDIKDHCHHEEARRALEGRG